MITTVSIAIYFAALFVATGFGGFMVEQILQGKPGEPKRGLVGLFLMLFLFVSAASLQIFA